QRSSDPMNLQQQRIFNKAIADPAYHHDDRLRLLCLANQVADIETSNRARRGEIPQRLDNRSQFRNIARNPSALRLTVFFLIEALKRFSQDLAAPVADGVKDVGNLEITQPLHQRGKQQHAEQKQSSDHDARKYGHGPGPIAIDIEKDGK